MVTYVFIEKPIRFGRFKRLGVPVSIAAMIGLAGFSAFALFDGGIPTRFSPEIRPVLALMKYNPVVDARYHNCWLPDTTPYETYGAECRTGATLIWGNSHAARLYSGFAQSETGIAQLTRDGCMPSLKAAPQSLCDTSNAAIVDEIVRLKPKRVIIFAAWLRYNNMNWQLPDESVEPIRRAIKRLKGAIDEVIILGPAPSWTPDLPTAVFHFWVANSRLPDRMQPASSNHHEVDGILATIAREQGARFISTFDQLCDVDGCLTHTPSSRSDLLSWDYGHLTTSGAHFVLQILRLSGRLNDR